LDNFYLISFCDENKFRVYLNSSNAELLKKFNELNRNEKTTRKFILVIEAVKEKISNKTQFNYEGSCELGDIFAIKVDNHRFYTLVIKNQGYRELFISRYGRKQSQKNDKKLTTTINSISKLSIQKLLE
jgi:hypothetical protein